MTPAPAPVRVLRLDDALERVGLSRSTVYELMSRHAFPAACKLSSRCSAWVEAEIDEWVRARIAERGEARP